MEDTMEISRGLQASVSVQASAVTSLASFIVY